VTPAVDLVAPICGSTHCITCGDDGVAMIVVAVDEERCLALCTDDADRHESVEIALVAPVAPGDQLLVHAGTAIATLPGAR
jgi:hydrogenase maturation factor